MINISEPFVAIGVPVYNGEAYLYECLDSILKQTYKNWECCIVDNKSSDRSLEIARRYKDKDSRFKVFSNDRFLTLMENWNMAYSKLNKEAKYIKLLAADDWIFPDYIERMVDVMEKNDDVGVCSSYRIDDKTVKCIGLDIYDGNVFNGHYIIEKELTGALRNISGSLSTVLFRHDIIKKLSAYPTIYNELNLHIDTELAFDVLNISNFGFVYQVLSYTRRHNETETSKHIRCNTHLCGIEQLYYKNKHLSTAIKKRYKQHRINYAYFLFKKRIYLDKTCVKWHKSNLLRPITLKEYLQAIYRKITFQNI